MKFILKNYFGHYVGLLILTWGVQSFAGVRVYSFDAYRPLVDSVVECKQFIAQHQATNVLDHHYWGGNWNLSNIRYQDKWDTYVKVYEFQNYLINTFFPAPEYWNWKTYGCFIPASQDIGFHDFPCDGAGSCVDVPELERQFNRIKGTTETCSTGNPIDISSGNKFQQEIILNRPLPFTLSYNSLDQHWRHSYAYALETSDSTATLIRPDGKGLGFTEASGVWTADDGDVFYTLSAFDNGSGSAWKVTTQSGSEELYDAQGKILSTTSLQGQSLSFTHTDTTTEVSDEFGNVLLLTQDSNEHLTAVALNGVSQATLTYDSGERLISRTDAQNNTVQYHYEDTNFPNHLTGITGANSQRFATWAYDAEGRGILSEHAGQETAQLAFNADGSTTVTNSLGKQTTYHYEEIEGLKRPVQIEGHASENCVAANQAYTYNAEGLVETQTDWSGNVTRFEYNDRGLVTRKTVAEGTAEERVTEQTWHTSLPLLLQSQTAGRITQYQYNVVNRLMSTEVLSVPSS